jgi:hypothetical protein
MFPKASHHTRVYSDKSFEWRPGRVHIPVSNFTGILGASGVSVGANTGAPVQQEISTFGVVGILMDTAGDVLDHNWSLPYDVDLNKDILFRVHWTSGSSTTADTITWKVFYKPIVPNSTTIAAASTALDTVIAQDTVIGAYTWQATEWGVLNGGTLAANVEKLMLQVELDAFAAGLTEDKFPLELEIAYSPKRLRGPDGMAHNAALPSPMLSNLY